MSVIVRAVDRPDVGPFRMPNRFRTDIIYFHFSPGERGAPELPAGEFWIDLEAARQWLDDGVLSVVSPLSSETRAEVQISAEQEEWLEWMIANNVQHVRFE